MKKIILAALAIGVLIPLFAGMKEFYYLSILLVFALLFFTIKKSVSLTDLLILFIVTIPLHSFRFGTNVHFIRLSEIAFIPLLIGWLIVKLLKASGGPLKIRKEFLFLLAYLLINVICLKNSKFPDISIKRIFILAYLFLFTYMVSDIVNKKEKINIIIKSMIAISGLSSIIAALQCVFPLLLVFPPVPIGRLLGITFYRAEVGWHDPNFYALYLAMNAALALSYILAYPERNKFIKVCFVLQLIGLLATFSRTASISLALVILYIFYNFGKKKIVITLLLLIAITAGIIATSTLTIYKKYPFLASAVYRVADKDKLAKQPTLVMGHRYAAFKANWAMFTDHPILGVGPFMAMYNFEKYKPAGYNYPIEWLASHNQYLQLLAEKGILGFLIFLGFILTMLLQINKYSRQTIDPAYKAYLLGFKSSIFVYLIASLALETSYELQFWLTMGLAIALFVIIHKDRVHA